MTKMSPESRRMLADLVADYEASRRRGASEWLLGMIPKEDQPEVARLAAEIVAVGVEAAAAPEFETPPCATSSQPPDLNHLAGIWEATLEYLKELSRADVIAGRSTKEGAEAEHRKEIEAATERVARSRDEILVLVNAGVQATDSVPLGAKNFLLSRAMDVQDAVRMVLRMVQNADATVKETWPPAPAPAPAPAKPAPAPPAPASALPAPWPPPAKKLAAAAPAGNFPFSRPAAPRHLNLPFSPAPAPPGRFTPALFKAAPRQGGPGAG